MVIKDDFSYLNAEGCRRAQDLIRLLEISFYQHSFLLRLHHQGKAFQSGPVSCPVATTAVVLNYGTMGDVDPASLTKVLHFQ